MTTATNHVTVGTQKYVPAPARRPLWARAIDWCLAKAVLGVWSLIKLSVLVAFAVAKSATVGKRRHQWLPVWFVVAAAVPVAHATAWWLGLAVAAFARPLLPSRASLKPIVQRLIKDRRFVSEKEMLIVGRCCAGVAWWHDVEGEFRPWAAGVVLVTIGLAGAIPWWRGRRVRPPDPFLVRWQEQVVPRVPKLAGRFTEWNPATGAGVLTLSDPGTTASAAAKLDEDAELALAHSGIPIRRGMVTISNDPRLTVREVRVVMSRSPEEMASRLHMWQGPTLHDGRYHLATTKTGQEVWVKFRDIQNGRARFWSWDGPTATGKGGSMRITGLEAALDPYTLFLILDGKWGAGLPYLRSGAALYASTPAQAGDLLDRYLAILALRATRYGREGRDSFVAGPGEPHIYLMIDELPQVLDKVKRVGAILNTVSATGGSLGVTFGAAKQRGDAASWGFGTAATTTRTNVIAGGGRWVGPSDDVQGSKSNDQKSKLDATKLPRNGGWCYVIDGDLGSPEPSRGLWVPNRRDVGEKGHASTYGTVEDWLETGTIHPELEDSEHAALLAEPLAADPPAVVSAVPPLPDEDTDDAEETEAGERVAGLNHPTTQRILALLPQSGGITRPELRDELRKVNVVVTPRRVNQILRRLEEESLAIEVDDHWRKAS